MLLAIVECGGFNRSCCCLNTSCGLVASNEEHYFTTVNGRRDGKNKINFKVSYEGRTCSHDIAHCTIYLVEGAGLSAQEISSF